VDTSRRLVPLVTNSNSVEFLSLGTSHLTVDEFLLNALGDTVLVAGGDTSVLGDGLSVGENSLDTESLDDSSDIFTGVELAVLVEPVAVEPRILEVSDEVSSSVDDVSNSSNSDSSVDLELSDVDGSDDVLSGHVLGSVDSVNSGDSSVNSITVSDSSSVDPGMDSHVSEVSSSVDDVSNSSNTDSSVDLELSNHNSSDDVLSGHVLGGIDSVNSGDSSVNSISVSNSSSVDPGMDSHVSEMSSSVDDVSNSSNSDSSVYSESSDHDSSDNVLSVHVLGSVDSVNSGDSSVNSISVSDSSSVDPGMNSHMSSDTHSSVDLVLSDNDSSVDVSLVREVSSVDVSDSSNSSGDSVDVSNTVFVGVVVDDLSSVDSMNSNVSTGTLLLVVVNNKLVVSNALMDLVVSSMDSSTVSDNLLMVGLGSSRRTVVCSSRRTVVGSSSRAVVSSRFRFVGDGFSLSVLNRSFFSYLHSAESSSARFLGRDVDVDFAHLSLLGLDDQFVGNDLLVVIGAWNAWLVWSNIDDSLVNSLDSDLVDEFVSHNASGVLLIVSLVVDLSVQVLNSVGHVTVVSEVLDSPVVVLGSNIVDLVLGLSADWFLTILENSGLASG
jgi:hypothetical protein